MYYRVTDKILFFVGVGLGILIMPILIIVCIFDNIREAQRERKYIKHTIAETVREDTESAWN